ncbi:hypothetical protein [Pseudactinotalea sp.]|uniref:hypothetical protein n=1 Tax=Pseudactinotalea sp. TaxID=1926260 RepID=UPI003B3A123C
MSDYVKLSEAPTLVFREPECGTCAQECQSDGDGWLCPSCGTSWGYNDYDQGGTLYEEWSGELLSGEPAPPDADYFNDPQLKAKRAELQAAQNVRLWGCEHGIFCRGKCAANVEIERQSNG